MMWLTTVMEILFAGAVVSLLADLGARRYGGRRGFIGLIAVGALLLSVTLVLSDWPSFAGGPLRFQPVASLLATIYILDSLGTFTAFTVLVVGLLVGFYSLLHLRNDDNVGPFYSLLLLLIGSLVGVVSAGDYLSFFLFWEGMSVAAYALVAFGRSELSLDAALKYFFMAGIGSLLALYGIALIYSVSGSLQLSAVAGLIASGSQTAVLGLAILVAGLGVEAAVVPLHTWLPDVYSAAPIPSASLVSGAVTGVGVFAILKVVQPLVPRGAAVLAPNASGLQLLLVALALITMFVGNLSGLYQTNLRRILSFSSIAQTGYMLAALATLSIPGLVAVVFSIWNHGLLKSNFFMLLGKGSPGFESASLETLSGTGRSDRPLGFLYASSALAMMGAPPFGMFWSEILVVVALLSASTGLFFWVAVAVVGNILLSIGYYYRVINTVVFGKANGTVLQRRLIELAPSAALLSLSLTTGLLPFLFLGHLI